MDIRRREGGKSGPKARNPLYFYYTAIFYLLSNAVTGAFIPAYPPADPPDTGPFDAKSGRIHGGYTRFARLSAIKIKNRPAQKRRTAISGYLAGVASSCVSRVSPVVPSACGRYEIYHLK